MRKLHQKSKSSLRYIELRANNISLFLLLFPENLSEIFQIYISQHKRNRNEWTARIPIFRSVTHMTSIKINNERERSPRAILLMKEREREIAIYRFSPPRSPVSSCFAFEFQFFSIANIELYLLTCHMSNKYLVALAS